MDIDRILNVHVPSASRMPLRRILEDKGYECAGWALTDPYLRINGTRKGFYSFREVRGMPFAEFNRRDLDPLRLLPAEAIPTFIQDSSEQRRKIAYG